MYVRQEDQIRFAKNRYRSDVFSGAHCADSAAVLPFFPDRFLSGKAVTAVSSTTAIPITVQRREGMVICFSKVSSAERGIGESSCSLAVPDSPSARLSSNALVVGSGMVTDSCGRRLRAAASCCLPETGLSFSFR